MKTTRVVRRPIGGTLDTKFGENTMTDDSNVKALRREPDPLIADVEISRLAKLNLIDYEREREPVAKRLSIRLPVLDELVALARLKTAAEPSRPFLPPIQAPPGP